MTVSQMLKLFFGTPGIKLIIFFVVISLISYILLFDLKYANFTPTLSPRCETFIDHVYQDLVKLHDITIGGDSETVVASQNDAMEVDGAPTSVTDETKRLERLAKTGFFILNIYKNNKYCVLNF